MPASAARRSAACLMAMPVRPNPHLVENQLGRARRGLEGPHEALGRGRLALAEHVGHLLLVGDDARGADPEVDVQEVAALDGGVGGVVEGDAAGALQLERAGEVELEPEALPLGRDPVPHVHQGGAAGG